MADANHQLNVKIVCLTITALLRSSKPRVAFQLFEQHMENAGGATSTLGNAPSAAESISAPAIAVGVRRLRPHRVCNKLFSCLIRSLRPS